MANFFTQLLRGAPETLLTPKTGGRQLLELRQLPHLPRAALLDLPKGTSACFVQNRQMSPVFHSGSRTLEAAALLPLTAGHPLTLALLWHAPQEPRSWHTRRQCPQTGAISAIRGHWRCRVTDPARALAQFAAMPVKNADEALAELDKRFASAVQLLLLRQAVPDNDIAAYPDRLSAYLTDALVPLMAEIGLAPAALTITITQGKPEIAAKREQAPQPAAQIEKPVQEPEIQAPEIRLEEPAHEKEPEPEITADLEIQPDDALILQLRDLPPEEKEYYCAVRGEHLGPFNSAGLQTLILDGTITQRTLLWKQGMTRWVPASTLPQLYWPAKDDSHETH